MRRHILIALAGLMCLPACDTQRVADLEKQNAELKAEVKNRDSVADYDLQSKCARDAKVWFRENWAADKDTMLLDHTNHHNQSDNQCYVVVEHHFHETLYPANWENDIELWNVNENSKLASFLEEHYPASASIPDPASTVITCEFFGKKCENFQEFEKLTGPYMNK
jgi:hypothetical protein